MSPHIRGARIEISLEGDLKGNEIVASHTWGED